MERHDVGSPLLLETEELHLEVMESSGYLFGETGERLLVFLLVVVLGSSVSRHKESTYWMLTPASMSSILATSRFPRIAENLIASTNSVVLLPSGCSHSKTPISRHLVTIGSQWG